MEEFLPEFLKVERDGDQNQEKPLRAPSSLAELVEAGKVMMRKEDQPRCEVSRRLPRQKNLT